MIPHLQQKEAILVSTFQPFRTTEIKQRSLQLPSQRSISCLGREAQPALPLANKSATQTAVRAECILGGQHIFYSDAGELKTTGKVQQRTVLITNSCHNFCLSYLPPLQTNCLGSPHPLLKGKGNAVLNGHFHADHYKEKDTGMFFRPDNEAG